MMKTLLLALALAASSGGGFSVGYSNMTGKGSIWNWRHGDNEPSGVGRVPEVGDKVTLAGTDRKLQSVTVWLGCTDRNPGGTVDVTVRVRAFDATTGLPGAVLATAAQTGVSYSFQNWQLTLTMSSVTLPDDVVVTIEMANGTQNGYGVCAKTGTTVGSSDPNQWFVRGSDGLWASCDASGNGLGNLALQINVVP